MLKAYVHPASLSDTEGGQRLLDGIADILPRLSHLWTDAGYMKTFRDWVKQCLGWTVEVVKRLTEPKGDYAELVKNFIGEAAYQQRYAKGFRVLPRRWVVERTFAWLLNQRRLRVDYELLPETSEAWMYLASARLLWKRLGRVKC